MFATITKAAAVAAWLGTGLVLAGCTSAEPEPVAPVPSAELQYPEFTGTWDEWAESYMGCLREQGWDVELGPPEEGLSFVIGAGDGQDSALAASQQTCYSAVGRIVEPALDDAGVRAQYDGNLAQYECLVAAGFSAQEPPSFDVYLDRFRTNVATWDPMLGVPGPDYTAALTACPRSGPGG